MHIPTFDERREWMLKHPWPASILLSAIFVACFYFVLPHASMATVWKSLGGGFIGGVIFGYFWLRHMGRRS